MIMQDMGVMIAQMWLSLKPYIDKKERSEAAVAFLRSCEDFVDLEAIREEATDDADSALLGAFAELLGEDPDEEDHDYNEEY
jgi:hypothetical protein